MDDTKNLAEKNTMEIILHAGDARVSIMKALDLIGTSDYQRANDLMKDAHKKLVLAHRLQTNKLQQEAEGKKIAYSVLFTHAQDTLMTINTEYNLVKHLIKVFEIKEGKENDGKK
ncbi:PTS lactose/cellobiose transporter subunit IIA [Liquorilactobacillus sicerae]|uniref:PTS lactose/cellobiose transporter subunit IIA n=1 Tax=Liquorilactobacillus sicerae TaxID=1416943 RepID=UPI002480BFE4|nr:PTS lactose/cellobiose transporter subunit IIA [Liquorilactobacillus sicerae]